VWWENGELARAAIRAGRDGPCRVRARRSFEVSCDGRAIPVERPEAAVAEFVAEAGKSYILAR
jgi:hypothetical protein